jgi:hypothetical protein
MSTHDFRSYEDPCTEPKEVSVSIAVVVLIAFIAILVFLGWGLWLSGREKKR